jgi:hypothetical protein
MIELNKEYFKKPYYFFLKDKGSKISLYYSVSSTLNEAKEKDEKIDIPKTQEKKVKNLVGNILKSNKTFSAASIKNAFKKMLDDTKKEVGETKLLAKILAKALNSYVKEGELNLDEDDIVFIKSQSKDILKILPLVVFQIVPGSTIATPFIVALAEKVGIKLTSKVPEKYKKDTKKEGGEIDELVDADGSMSSSNIPILDQGQHTQWTQDMRAGLNRMANGNFPFKARIYFGESEEKQEPLEEEDFSDAYGYEEIDDDNIKTFKGCIAVFKNLEIADPFERYERCMSFGFDPDLDEEGKQRIVELRKEKMRHMIDELLLNKKSKDKDIKTKDNDDNSPINKILMRNLESVKKLAEKEGISLDKLIKHLKDGE